MDRRHFIKGAGGVLAAGALPLSNIELAFADKSKNFTFAYISDSHIQHIKGNQFVRNWDDGLKRAVAECNLMNPRPDFVIYGGDLAQLGNKPELDPWRRDSRWCAWQNLYGNGRARLLSRSG